MTAARKPLNAIPAKQKKGGTDLTPDSSRRGSRKPEDQALKDRAARSVKAPAKKLDRLGQLTAAEKSVPTRTPRARKAAAKSLETIKAWSYSRYSTWRQCAFLAYLKYIQKLKEPDNPRQARGSDIHKLAEDYVNGTVTSVAKLPKLSKTPSPRELELRKHAEEFFGKMLPKFKREFDELRKARAVTEQSMAFTQDWKATGWFDSNVWVRVKTDATLFSRNRTQAKVTDYKTGRQYLPDHEEQLELYAVATFLSEPKVDEVLCEDWYLDSGTKLERTYTRAADMARLMKKWEGQVRPMLADGRYDKKPSDKCRNCHFRKANGGPCTY